MGKGSDIHSGHRQRMYEKLSIFNQSLADHELLEILLFSYIPRRNTNGLAHLLIKEFGSLENVFNATVEELMLVEGVGKTVANGIVVTAEIIKRIIKAKSKKAKFSSVLSYGLIERDVVNYFNLQTEEKFIVILYDNNARKMSVLEYFDKKKDQVSADIPEIARAIALHKPTYIVMAHNHPSGSPKPSFNDDLATGKMNILCSSHGVTLVDHIIVCDQTAYSYHVEGQMDRIKKAYNLEKIYLTIKEE